VHAHPTWNRAAVWTAKEHMSCHVCDLSGECCGAVRAVEERTVLTAGVDA
jgi:hypothetical protein